MRDNAFLSRGRHALDLDLGTYAPGTYTVIAQPDNGRPAMVRILRLA